MSVMGLCWDVNDDLGQWILASSNQESPAVSPWSGRGEMKGHGPDFYLRNVSIYIPSL